MRARSGSSTALLRSYAFVIVIAMHLVVVFLAFNEQRASAVMPITTANVAEALRTPEGSTATHAARVLASPPAPKPTAATRSRTPATKRGQRWIPSGTGMWTHRWADTEGGNTLQVVRRAKQMGLSHLYVRTGTKKGGFDAKRQLSQLLKATQDTDIKIIAWDFPYLNNPIADARRLAAAANFRAPGTNGKRIQAVAPDIETSAEGTNITAPKMDTYFRELRRLLPADIPILATVPWPSEHRLGKFPYWVAGKWADAIMPMSYWINRDPSTVTYQSITRLRGYGIPVLPVGQAYDPRIDVPGLAYGPPTGAQMRAFFNTAHKYGAPAVSLWVWQLATPTQWSELRAAGRLFPLRVTAA